MDPAPARCWLVRVEHVGRLHHQVYPIGPHFSETTQIEEGGVPFTVCRLHGDVVDLTAQPTREPAATSFERADDLGQLKRPPISRWASSVAPRNTLAGVNRSPLSPAQPPCAALRSQPKQLISIASWPSSSSAAWGTCWRFKWNTWTASWLEARRESSRPSAADWARCSHAAGEAENQPRGVCGQDPYAPRLPRCGGARRGEFPALDPATGVRWARNQAVEVDRKRRRSNCNTVGLLRAARRDASRLSG